MLVAELVSSQPAAPTWYLHPGTLTAAQVQGAASLTDLQLHKLMERCRATQTPAKTLKPRRRRS